MSYVELRCKTNFSFLTGASYPEELIGQAIQLGLHGIALTDINGVYGMPKGYKVAKEYPGFRYICGAELTFHDHANLTLLAQTREAYGFICNILTESKRGKEKGEGNLYFSDFLNLLSDPVASHLIVLPRIDDIPDEVSDRVIAGRPYKQIQFVKLQERFGRNLHLPLTFYRDGLDPQRVRQILEWQKRYDLKLVATNDVEYHVKSRKPLQDVLISIREGKSLNEIGFMIRSNGERYLKSPEQMARLYRDFPEALAQTVKIAESCTFSPSELKYRYPSEWIPAGFSAQTYLEHLVWKHAPVVYKNQMPDRVRKQLIHELQLIDQLNFADYFLTIYDVVSFARSKGILCQGRGSAANSAVCYVLGITSIDPVQMDLLFERFISAERNEPPDIDIDFEHERREEVIQYIYQKYGRHRAGMVSAVITYRYRSAFREACKAFGVPVGTLSAKKVERQFDELAKSHPDPQKLREKIDSIARQMQGFPRHLSIHSGGFTLSADPIIDIVPVEPARMPGRTIIQWDKYDLDILGLIKVDLLALGMLSCLNKTLNMVNLKLHEIPHDDKPTYQMIQRRETVGTFQIESRAQMSMLGRLKPENFYDLVIEVAIVRPGPIIGKMVHPYLRRRKGLEKVRYPNAKVEQILGRTLGVPLFQEQVMKLAITLADFSPGEADVLRKSINAWRSSASIGEMGARLMAGLLKNGLSRSFANQIFEQIQGFSHYGFPESHAASFALLAYASCYLKCHYPAEFACGLVNSQPMGFYRPDTILFEAIRHGVQVLPVSVLKSQWDCIVEKVGDNDGKAIRLGFCVVRGLPRRDVEELIQEREQCAFANLADFIKRSCLRRDILSRLALAGRFDEFHWGARDSLWAILEYQNLLAGPKGEQLSLFADTPYAIEPSRHFIDPSPFEKIQNDYNAFSLSVHGHPMTVLRRKMAHLPSQTSESLQRVKHGSRVRVAGLVLVRQKPPTANGTCFCTLEDEFGFIDLVLFKKTYAEYKEVFLNHCFIIVEGKLERAENTMNLIVSKVSPVWHVSTMEETPLAIEPAQYFYS